eukprot:TRINITY_DN106510_c0_g1_i1.p1 TRINITY_DN106510_c0_g1~~TRINITY_DN106510_c0_g1_i1.p1  ORF type:complete len:287 (-),score=45.59 TRINITY_DN106510_c0_g1_i1:75-866(-)
MSAAAGYSAGSEPAAAPSYVEFSRTTREFWKKQLADGGVQWYRKAEQWWVDNCPPTVNGVLGGFENLDPPDVKASLAFLDEAKSLKGLGGLPMKREIALDGGAGIGRVTKHMLSNVFDKVDLVEGNQRLLDAVDKFLDDKLPRLGQKFCSELQNFTPEAGRYDCIWVQWVVIYLTDADFAAFLRRMAKGLRPGGLIFIKENVLSERSGEILKDEDDSSVTRCDELMRHIFRQADLEILSAKPQTDWPEGMFPVMMYALCPKSS